MCLLMGDEAAAGECGKPPGSAASRRGVRQAAEGRAGLPLPGQPHWLFLLGHALDKGDLETAAPLANKLARNRDKSDLSYMGAVPRWWTYTDLDQAVEQLERRHVQLR